MAINNFGFPDPIKTGALPQVGKAAPKAPAAKTAPQAEAVDRVEISPEALLLRSLTAKLNSIADTRPDVVEEVRSKLANIANGAALDAKLAEKLLTEN